MKSNSRCRSLRIYFLAALGCLLSTSGALTACRSVPDEPATDSSQHDSPQPRERRACQLPVSYAPTKFELRVKPAEPVQERHPERSRLKPLHHYFHVGQIGPYAHHFTVWMHDNEVGPCHVAVLPRDGAPPAVDVQGCGFGVGDPPDEASVPPEVEEFAHAAMRALCEQEKGATVLFRTQYHGRYRAIRVVEVVPRNLESTLGGGAEVLFKANEDLSQVVDTEIYRSSHFGLLCSSFWDPACDRPRWAKFVAGTERLGLPLLDLRRLEDEREPPVPLKEAVLATARAIESDQYGSPLDAILEEQAAGLYRPFTVQFTASKYSNVDSEKSIIPVGLTLEKSGSRAHGYGEWQVDEKKFTIEVQLLASGPLTPEDIDAVRERSLKLEVRIEEEESGRSHARTFDLPTRRTLQLEDATVLWATSESRAPRHYKFEYEGGPSTRFDFFFEGIYFGR